MKYIKEKSLTNSDLYYFGSHPKWGPNNSISFCHCILNKHKQKKVLAYITNNITKSYVICFQCVFLFVGKVFLQ